MVLKIEIAFVSNFVVMKTVVKVNCMLFRIKSGLGNLLWKDYQIIEIQKIKFVVFQRSQVFDCSYGSFLEKYNNCRHVFIWGATLSVIQKVHGKKKELILNLQCIRWIK